MNCLVESERLASSEVYNKYSLDESDFEYYFLAYTKDSIHAMDRIPLTTIWVVSELQYLAAPQLVVQFDLLTFQKIYQ